MKKALLIILLFAIQNTYAQQIVPDSIAKRLKVKTATRKTFFRNDSIAYHTQAETYDLNGKVIRRIIFYNDDRLSNVDSTLYYYNAKGQLIKEVNTSPESGVMEVTEPADGDSLSTELISEVRLDTKNYSYNTEGKLTEVEYTYNNELGYKEKWVYFTNKDYISGADKYSYGALGEINFVSSYKYDRKGNTIESDENLGYPIATIYTEDKQGSLSIKEERHPDGNPLSKTTYTYNSSNQLVKESADIYYEENVIGDIQQIDYTHNKKGLIIKQVDTSKDPADSVITATTTYISQYTFY